VSDGSFEDDGAEPARPDSPTVRDAVPAGGGARSAGGTPRGQPMTVGSVSSMRLNATRPPRRGFV
jgi:hypothetical protein